MSTRRGVNAISRFTPGSIYLIHGGAITLPVGRPRTRVMDHAIRMVETLERCKQLGVKP